MQGVGSSVHLPPHTPYVRQVGRMNRQDAPATTSTRRLVTAEELAEVLGTSARTVYRMGARGQVPSYRVGARGIRFDAAEVLAALREERR